MLKILWKMGEIAPEEQFLPLSTIFYYLMLDFYVNTGIRFSLRDKWLFEITEVKITRVDCIYYCLVSETADNVNTSSIKVDMKNNKTGAVHIHWDDPPNPNGLIVTYEIEYSKSNIQNVS